MNRYVIIGGDSLSDGCTSHQCRKKIKPPEKKNQLPDEKKIQLYDEKKFHYLMKKKIDFLPNEKKMQLSNGKKNQLPDDDHGHIEGLQALQIVHQIHQPDRRLVLALRQLESDVRKLVESGDVEHIAQPVDVDRHADEQDDLCDRNSLI